MNPFKKLISLIILLTSFSTFAEIRETSSMNDITSLLTPGTIIIFDLDNTVLEAQQTLGTDQFFSFLVKKAESNGLSNAAAKDWALEQSFSIQPLTEVRAVEKVTPHLIEQLQRENYTIFALTARPVAWAMGTLGQVSSLGINFSLTAPQASDTFLKQMKNGIFFLPPKAEKGPTLVNFLKENNLHPQQVIFIDDKLANVQSVEAALQAENIPHIELRYRAADARVQSFNTDIAEFEYNYYLKNKVFISDEVAAEMMH